MVAPTFKRATDTTPDASGVKYTAPDIVKIVDVITGVHANERLQVQNIEQVANPWTYYIYTDTTGLTLARRGDTNRAEFTDSSNPRTVIQNAIDTAYSAYSKAIIFLAPQTFTAPIPTGSNPPVDGSTSGLIALGTQGSRTLKNNVSIIGAGMDKTILQNFSIQKEVTQFSENIVVADLTVDAGAVGTLDKTKTLADGTQPAPNDTLGYQYALSFSSYSKNFKAIRVRARNARQFALHWGAQVRSLFFDSIFYDGGLGGPGDTAAGGSAYFTDQTETTANYDETAFMYCKFEKNLGRAGGLCTTGRTGNLLFLGNAFVNIDGLAYQGISIENDSSYGPYRTIRIIGNRGYGSRAGCQVGNGATGSDFKGEKAIIIGNEFTGTIAVRKGEQAIIANNIVHNANGTGILASNYDNVKISNNLVRNTNIDDPNISTPTTCGCYVTECKNSQIDHLTVIDTADTRTTTPLNPVKSGEITTPSGLLVTMNSSGTGGKTMIDNCDLIGDSRASPSSPFWKTVTDSTQSGQPLRVKNMDTVIIRGGYIKGPTTNIFATNTTIDCMNLVGYNGAFAAESVTTPANGASYTNNDGVPEMIFIYGGTLSGSGITKSSLSLSGTTLPLQLLLQPGEVIGFNYSSAPTVVKWRK